MEAFNGWAAHYDSSMLQPLLYHRSHDAALRLIRRHGMWPNRLLDVGCGTGHLLSQAGTLFPRAVLIGVDPCAPMASIAVAAAPASVVRAAAEQLPFAGGTFNSVTASFTYRHWRDPDAGIAEIARVLAPGGIFVLADSFAAPSRAGLIARGESALPRTLRDAMTDSGLEVLEIGTLPGVAPVTVITLAVTRRQRTH